MTEITKMTRMYKMLAKFSFFHDYLGDFQLDSFNSIQKFMNHDLNKSNSLLVRSHDDGLHGLSYIECVEQKTDNHKMYRFKVPEKKLELISYTSTPNNHMYYEFIVHMNESEGLAYVTIKTVDENVDKVDEVTYTFFKGSRHIEENIINDDKHIINVDKQALYKKKRYLDESERVHERDNTYKKKEKKLERFSIIFALSMVLIGIMMTNTALDFLAHPFILIATISQLITISITIFYNKKFAKAYSKLIEMDSEVNEDNYISDEGLAYLNEIVTKPDDSTTLYRRYLFMDATKTIDSKLALIGTNDLTPAITKDTGLAYKETILEHCDIEPLSKTDLIKQHVNIIQAKNEMERIDLERKKEKISPKYRHNLDSRKTIEHSPYHQSLKKLNEQVVDEKEKNKLKMNELKENESHLLKLHLEQYIKK